MNLDQQILSDITIHMKYARYNDLLERREEWKEIAGRNKNMHLDKLKDKPELHNDIEWAYQLVEDKRVLPSMRSAQFAGKPIQINNSRVYNCAFLPIDDYRAFSETMFLLLGGTGVGYSVQRHHVEKLPEIRIPNKERKYVVGDSIEGWSDAVKTLMKAYFGKTATKPRFDFSDIRAKGERLITSGGKAPGPEPLKRCLFNIETLLQRKNNGDKLSPIEVHDIVCHLADAVLAGGIRRAALISLFSIDDDEMLACKAGNWWELNPQRGRANNSAVVIRHRVTKDDFLNLWSKIEASGSGEPGIYFSNNQDYGTNPCCFVGDTLIKTFTGWQKLVDLKDKTLPLINVNGETVVGRVWSNGVKDIVSVKTRTGKEIKCTADHRFMLTDGNECQAKDLKGKRIMPFVDYNDTDDLFTKLGFIQGDGSLTRLNSEDHKGLEVHIGANDFDVATLFDVDWEEGKCSYYLNGYNEMLKGLKFDATNLTERRLPETFDKWSCEAKASFFRGLFSANGGVIKGHRLSFKSTCKTLIEQMGDYLESVGIFSYVTTNKAKDVKFCNGTYTCKESYDLNIGRFDDIVKFAELIGFVHKYKTEALKELILTKSPIISSVKSCGSEEVFDFNLDDDTHWGVVSSDGVTGFVAHNCEIALRPFQFCNLSEISASAISSEDDFYDACKAAAIIGTLQASYTDFHYLRDIWKTTTEKDALIGVGITGIASNTIDPEWLKWGAEIVKKTNAEWADHLGINAAARNTTIKPSGTTSLVCGSSSGIHAWHDDYYIRRVRVGKNEAIYDYLVNNHPELIEDDVFNAETQAVISIPQAAPEGATTRSEDVMELLERVKLYNLEWVKKGHRKGDNTNNVSATISIKDDEWEKVGEWMWENRDTYNGLSVLPFDGGTYTQAPFQSITKEEYEEMVGSLHSFDPKKIVETVDNTTLSAEAACAGGACEIV